MTLEVCLQSLLNMGWSMSIDRYYYLLGLEYSNTGNVSVLMLGKYIVYMRMGRCIKLFGIVFTLP